MLIYLFIIYFTNAEEPPSMRYDRQSVDQHNYCLQEPLSILSIQSVDWHNQLLLLRPPVDCINLKDSGYPHDSRADKNPYPHDRRADKDSYPHHSNNQCITLRLQLSIVMINVQLMLV